MPFVSKAQQGFAFATGQPWAKEFADKTDFKKLPVRVRVENAVKAITHRRSTFHKVKMKNGLLGDISADPML